MGERNAISRKLEEVTDSVSTIELKILEVESKAETTSELGPLKYISKITGMPMDEIVNLLLLTINTKNIGRINVKSVTTINKIPSSE